ncbi:MAG: histidinol-phosphate transaminase [Pseudomonadota bacterium]
MTTRSRSAIGNLPTYTFPDLDLPGIERVVVLAQNELAIPPSPNALKAARDSVGAVNRYSDIEQLDLRRAIAEVHRLDPDKLVCGAGSLELMSLIATAYCMEGREVVVSEYGYKFFQVLCSVAGATVKVVPEPEMEVDVDGILAAVTEQTSLVFLVNPGNPTGLVLPSGAVRRLRQQLPPSVMLILDCAYAEFSEDESFEAGFDLVDSGENVVVLRTFSKAYGLAGMRVGWAYAPADVVDAILKIRPPNSISTPSLAAAEAAVRDREYLQQVCREVNRLRTDFISLLQALGFEALPSKTNFVLIRCPDDKPIAASTLERRLREFGVIVRPMGSYDLHDYLRISIGSAEEMEIIGMALKQIVSG